MSDKTGTFLLNYGYFFEDHVFFVHSV